MRAYGVTHRGYVRKKNEDRFLIRELSDTSCIVAVADGMGGRAGGEVAAGMVMDIVTNFVPGQSRPSENELHALIFQANSEILKEAARNPALTGMGTTATLAWIDNRSVYWSHVGDSRLYHFQDHALVQVTRDHNLAGMLMELGELTAEQARMSPLRSMLQQCVGCPECDPDRGRFQGREKELLLLCSDGLSGVLTHQTMQLGVSSSMGVRNKTESLLEAALEAGGRDNVTVILVEIA